MLFVAGVLLAIGILGAFALAAGTVWFFGLLAYDRVEAYRARPKATEEPEFVVPARVPARVPTAKA